MNPLDGKSFAQFISRILVLTGCETINTNNLTSPTNKVKMKMKTNTISKFFTGAIFSGILLLALFGITVSNVNAQQEARIKVQKQVCDSIGQQNTCNGNNNSLEGETIEFDVFVVSNTPTPTPTPIATIPVVIDNGGGNLGFTSQDGFVVGTTYRVCERTPLGFDSIPQPDGSTGGNQTAEGDCIIFTAGAGQNVVQFINVPVGTVTIIKDVLNGNSTTSFDFTATGLSPSSFSLVDTGNSSADRIVFTNVTLGTKTVTEALTAGFSLSDITCTGGTTSTDLATRTATINVNQGDNVVCTFTNTMLGTTAAGADISGRVLASNGRAISRATVTVLNTHTLETRTVTTNRYGYFGFQEMTVGDFYLISVASKGYWFATNNQGIGLTGNLTELEFIGTPFNNPVFGTSIFNDVKKSKGNQP